MLKAQAITTVCQGTSHASQPNGLFDDAFLHRSDIKKFVKAAKGNDVDAFFDTMQQIETLHLWREAFIALKGVSASEPVRRCFLSLYREGGDSLRSNVAQDAILIHGLKALLPKYDGPSLTVYRGAHKDERRFRSYGAAWTTELEVAQAHAMKDYHGGDSLVLKASATREAIVSAPGLESSDWNEREIVVDRRLLQDVLVIREKMYRRSRQ